MMDNRKEKKESNEKEGEREREREREREEGEGGDRANGMNIRLFILRSISRNLIPPRPAESLVPPGTLLAVHVAWLHLKFLTPPPWLVPPRLLCLSSPMNGERTVVPGRRTTSLRERARGSRVANLLRVFYPTLKRFPALSTVIVRSGRRRHSAASSRRAHYTFLVARICLSMRRYAKNSGTALRTRK